MNADQEQQARQRIIESRLALQSFIQLYIDMLKKLEKKET